MIGPASSNKYNTNIDEVTDVLMIKSIHSDYDHLLKNTKNICKNGKYIIQIHFVNQDYLTGRTKSTLIYD